MMCWPLSRCMTRSVAKERFPFVQLDKIADKGLELGVLTEQEAELLRRTETQRLETINVDDFDTEELMADKSLLQKDKKKSAKAA